MITTTRTSNGLSIHGVQRRPDGMVVIHFSIAKAGVYYNVRQFTKVFNRKFPGGFVMTPAIADPMHSRDPLMVPFPGQIFRFVWNAPVDGYGTGSLYGTTFQLAYVDFLCCDEFEGGETPPVTPPPPPVPPVPPVPPPVPPPPTPTPPSPTPVPIDPHPPTQVVPPEYPPTVNEDPQPPTWHPGGSVDGGILRDPVPEPVLPPWMPGPFTGPTQTPSGTPIVPTPSQTPEAYPYVNLTDVTPPTDPVSIGTPPPQRPLVPLPADATPEMLARYGLAVYRPLPPYPVAPELLGLFAVPQDPAT